MYSIILYTHSRSNPEPSEERLIFHHKFSTKNHETCNEIARGVSSGSLNAASNIIATELLKTTGEARSMMA